MKQIRRIIVSVALAGVVLGTAQAHAQRNEMPAGYPQSLEADLASLLGRLRDGDVTSGLLVQLASTYFDLADDLLTDEKRRRTAFEAGAKAAEQAFQLDDSNADAHFFHAANLGSAERLRGIANAAMVVKEIKHCAMRAIELNPKHAQALQMMGGLLMELQRPRSISNGRSPPTGILRTRAFSSQSSTRSRIALTTRNGNWRLSFAPTIPTIASPGSGRTSRKRSGCLGS